MTSNRFGWPSVHRDSLLHKAVEQFSTPLRGSAIEPEGELVQISVQVRLRDSALVDAQEPPLQQGHHPIDTRQEIPSDLSLLPNNVVDIPSLLQPAVPRPAVCANHATGGDRLLDSAFQVLSRSIGHAPQTDTPDAVPIHLSCDDDQGFPFSAAPRFPWLGPTQVGFINFHGTPEAFSPRSDHRSSELVQPRPSGPVAAQAQGALESQRTHSRFLIRHVPHSPEPQSQRILCVLEEGTGQDRSLKPTVCAVIQAASGRPHTRALAAQTSDTLRPSQTGQIRPARLFRGKPSFKLHQRARVVFHTRRYYRLGILESSA